MQIQWPPTVSVRAPKSAGDPHRLTLVLAGSVLLPACNGSKPSAEAGRVPNYQSSPARFLERSSGLAVRTCPSIPSSSRKELETLGLDFQARADLITIGQFVGNSGNAPYHLRLTYRFFALRIYSLAIKDRADPAGDFQTIPLPTCHLPRQKRSV